MKKQFWLADGQRVDQYGTVWEVKLIDGPHTSPHGVAEAQQIIKGIGLDRGKNRNYVMVTVQGVPEKKVKLNQKAIETCKSAVDAFHNKTTRG